MPQEEETVLASLLFNVSSLRVMLNYEYIKKPIAKIYWKKQRENKVHVKKEHEAAALEFMAPVLQEDFSSEV